MCVAYCFSIKSLQIRSKYLAEVNPNLKIFEAWIRISWSVKMSSLTESGY